MGLNAAAGVSFAASDALSFYGELNFVNMNYAPTESEIVKKTVDGDDKLSEMDTREIETEYVDSYTTDPSDPPDEDQPSKSLKQAYPFGSFGLDVGVKLSF